jgi:hypothetical protein
MPGERILQNGFRLVLSSSKERAMKRIVPMIFILSFSLFVGVAKAEWTASQRITWTSGSSEHPAIAVDSLGYPHVVWDDYTPWNSEIYYKKYVGMTPFSFILKSRR